MTPGNGLIVTTFVVLQPEGNTYLIVVVPGAKPHTTPVEAPTVATAKLLLDQVPPAVTWLSVIQLPSQTVAAPVMAGGAAFTVTVAMPKQVVPIA
jgi:hypothetical protein